MERRREFAANLERVQSAARAEAQAFLTLTATAPQHPMGPALQEIWHRSRDVLDLAMDALNASHLRLFAELPKPRAT